MAELQRTVILGDDAQSAISQDMDVVFEALNGGTDPASLPNGKLTADKMLITTPGSGGAGFRVGPSGTLPAGGVGVLLIGLVGPNGATGPSSGQFYVMTPYLDFFVDPTGSAGGPITISNIYTGNTAWTGSGGVILPTYYLRDSSSTGIPQIFQFLVAVHNVDTVAHYVYASFNFALINTQGITGS